MFVNVWPIFEKYLLKWLTMDEVFEITSSLTRNKAFRLVETLFVQANQVRTESKQTSLFGNKKMRFVLIQYELDCLGWKKFLHVEMPYSETVDEAGFRPKASLMTDHGFFLSFLWCSNLFWKYFFFEISNCLDTLFFEIFGHKNMETVQLLNYMFLFYKFKKNQNLYMVSECLFFSFYFN